MKRLHWLFAIVLFLGCGKVLAVRQIPEITLGEASFFRTLEAHTDAPIARGIGSKFYLTEMKLFPAFCAR
jgi:hypothetical protein